MSMNEVIRNIFRALHDRIKDSLKNLPPSYHLSNPSMFFLNSTDSKITSGPNFAIAWSRGDENYEIINTRTGQTKNGISKFSKQTFLKRFVSIIRKLSDDHQKINLGVYSDLKFLAEDYQVTNFIKCTNN